MALLLSLEFMINCENLFSRNRLGTVPFQCWLQSIDDSALPVDECSVDIEGQEAVVGEFGHDEFCVGKD